MAETIDTPPMPRAGDTTASGLSAMPDGGRRARDVIDEGAELGAEMLAVIRENATAFYREQRDHAANEIDALGELLHNSVRSIQRRDAIVARFADEAALQIGGFADWLRARSWSELTDDVESLARRYPLAFLSTAAGLGFLAVRLWTASGDRTPAEPMDEQPQSMVRRGGGAVMPGERDVVAGVSGGAAARHDAGLPGED